MAAMLCTNHSWPFEKAYTPIYQTFRMFSLHIDAPSHTFSYGGLQCLSESRRGSHETKSIFRICARRYSQPGFHAISDHKLSPAITLHYTFSHEDAKNRSICGVKRV